MVIAKATKWLAEKREPAVPSAQPAQALPEDVDDAEYDGAEDSESDEPEEDVDPGPTRPPAKRTCRVYRQLTGDSSPEPSNVMGGMITEPDSGNGGTSRHSIPQRDAAGGSRLSMHLQIQPLNEARIAYADNLKREIAEVKENITRTEANIDNSSQRRVGYLETFRNSWSKRSAEMAEMVWDFTRHSPFPMIGPGENAIACASQRATEKEEDHSDVPRVINWSEINREIHREEPPEPMCLPDNRRLRFSRCRPPTPSPELRGAASGGQAQNLIHALESHQARYAPPKTPAKRTPSKRNSQRCSRLPITNLPSVISPHVADIKKKFLEYDQRVADLECEVQEKEQELKDKDFQMNTLEYKSRYEKSQQQWICRYRSIGDPERGHHLILGNNQEPGIQPGYKPSPRINTKSQAAIIRFLALGKITRQIKLLDDRHGKEIRTRQDGL
ncbi:uncharacterized protein FFFS_15797 [Fusarium fujikuroi]|nr:uncharacterized protein FFFS_15797 [Fusarium fujikuroi]